MVLDSSIGKSIGEKSLVNIKETKHQPFMPDRKVGERIIEGRDKHHKKQDRLKL